MAANPASRSAVEYLASGLDLVPATLNDATNEAVAGRAIRCKPITGTAGTLKFTTLNGQDRTTEIAVGELLIVGVKRIWTTGTTATGLEIVT